MATPTALVTDLLGQLLSPIPGGESPAGGGLSVSALDEIREAIQGEDWSRARDLAAESLRTKSKHLQVGAFYVEATARLEGWTTLEDGFRLMDALIERYWNNGLLPESIDGDHAYRARPIEGLSRKAAEILRQLPLTKRTDGENFSLNSLHDQTKGALWEAVVEKSPLEFYEGLEQQLKSVSGALSALDQRMNEDRFFGLAEAPRTEELRDALAQITGLVSKILEKKRQKGKDSENEISGYLPSSDAEDGARASARKLVGAGRVQDAIREMTQLVAQEHARNRFLRRLELAEVIAREVDKPDRLMLAIVILEELDEQIKTHNLINWESPELIGRVWGQLARLCDRVPQKQSSVADLRLRLRRLDPWQALKWE